MIRDAIREHLPYRGLVLVMVATVFVTASFIGVLSIIEGRAEGLTNRFPYYLVLTGGVFASFVVILENYIPEGLRIILTSVITAVLAGIVLSLAVEGLYYTVRFSGELVASQIALYMLAAAFICTGMVYWGVRHWREFIAAGPTR